MKLKEKKWFILKKKDFILNEWDYGKSRRRKRKLITKKESFSHIFLLL